MQEEIFPLSSKFPACIWYAAGNLVEDKEILCFLLNSKFSSGKIFKLRFSSAIIVLQSDNMTFLEISD